MWWPIVINLNLNHQRNFKPHLHYYSTLKFKTEIKNEIDFYHYFYLYVTSHKFFKFHFELHYEYVVIKLTQDDFRCTDQIRKLKSVW